MTPAAIRHAVHRIVVAMPTTGATPDGIFPTIEAPCNKDGIDRTVSTRRRSGNGCGPHKGRASRGAVQLPSERLVYKFRSDR